MARLYISNSYCLRLIKPFEIFPRRRFQAFHADSKSGYVGLRNFGSLMYFTTVEFAKFFVPILYAKHTSASN